MRDVHDTRSDRLHLLFSAPVVVVVVVDVGGWCSGVILVEGGVVVVGVGGGDTCGGRGALVDLLRLVVAAPLPVFVDQHRPYRSFLLWYILPFRCLQFASYFQLQRGQ